MYEKNNGSPEWGIEQLNIRDTREMSSAEKEILWRALTAAFILVAAVVISQLDLKCLSNLGLPNEICETGLLDINYHEHPASGTKGFSIWSNGNRTIFDRAGFAWIPDQGLKLWLKAFFTDGLQEYFQRLPKFP